MSNGPAAMAPPYLVQQAVPDLLNVRLMLSHKVRVEPSHGAGNAHTDAPLPVWQRKVVVELTKCFEGLGQLLYCMLQG